MRKNQRMKMIKVKSLRETETSLRRTGPVGFYSEKDLLRDKRTFLVIHNSTCPLHSIGYALNSRKKDFVSHLISSGSLTSRPSVHKIYFIDFVTDEDLKSSSEKEKGTMSKSVKNMKLRKAKEANQDIGAIKRPYLTNHEEFINETGFPGFYTQQEHTANWLHTKRSNGLGDMPFTSQTIYTASELVLFKESNSLLKECATQTHV
ncbi:hypothetical protein F2Q70_00038803 [Brassica cretica]|uniref:Uncharacterized protein n=2 Tax=Brassica cretica TaxID=69181 RepID=A0A8S9K0W3_BRACR|nr:hypothetical protein F2Q70_00038803 [Brassica cretica]